MEIRQTSKTNIQRRSWFRFLRQMKQGVAEGLRRTFRSWRPKQMCWPRGGHCSDLLTEAAEGFLRCTDLRSHNCYKGDKAAPMVIWSVLKGRGWGARMSTSGDTFSSSRHSDHRPAASDGRSGKHLQRNHGFQTSEEKRSSFPRRKTTALFILVLHVQTLRNAEAMKSHRSNPYRPKWQSNPQFFARPQKCHLVTTWVKSKQFYFVQQRSQLVHTGSSRGQETGPCAFGHLVQLLM